MSEENQRQKGTKPIPLARCQTTWMLPERDNNTNWLIVFSQKPLPFILSPNCSPSQLPIAVFGLLSWILGCSCFQLVIGISAWSTWESKLPWSCRCCFRDAQTLSSSSFAWITTNRNSKMCDEGILVGPLSLLKRSSINFYSLSNLRFDFTSCALQESIVIL